MVVKFIKNEWYFGCIYFNIKNKILFIFYIMLYINFKLIYKCGFFILGKWNELI